MQDAARGLVIGIGNPDRGDDGAGRAVAQSLRGRLPPGIGLVEETGEVSALMARLDGARRAWLVDACTSGAAPGTLLRFDVAAGPLPQEAFALSTHGMGLAEAVELARALGQLPPLCVVHAIEAASAAPGAGLSEAVAQAIPAAAQRILDEIGSTMAL